MTNKPKTIKEINKEFCENVRLDEVGAITESTLAIAQWFQSQYTQLFKECMGGSKKVENFNCGGLNAKMMMRAGYNQAKDEIRSRAKQGGMDI